MVHFEGVTDFDVLCFRGSVNHRGNRRYHGLLEFNKDFYNEWVEPRKTQLVASIVSTIRQQSGRFLQFDEDSKSWREIGDTEANAQTFRALAGERAIEDPLPQGSSVAAIEVAIASEGKRKFDEANNEAEDDEEEIASESEAEPQPKEAPAPAREMKRQEVAVRPPQAKRKKLPVRKPLVPPSEAKRKTAPVPAPEAKPTTAPPLPSPLVAKQKTAPPLSAPVATPRKQKRAHSTHDTPRTSNRPSAASVPARPPSPLRGAEPANGNCNDDERYPDEAPLHNHDVPAAEPMNALEKETEENQQPLEDQQLVEDQQQLVEDQQQSVEEQQHPGEDQQQPLGRPEEVHQEIQGQGRPPNEVIRNDVLPQEVPMGDPLPSNNEDNLDDANSFVHTFNDSYEEGAEPRDSTVPRVVQQQPRDATYLDGPDDYQAAPVHRAAEHDQINDQYRSRRTLDDERLHERQQLHERQRQLAQDGAERERQYPHAVDYRRQDIPRYDMMQPARNPHAPSRAGVHRPLRGERDYASDYLRDDRTDGRYDDDYRLGEQYQERRGGLARPLGDEGYGRSLRGGGYVGSFRDGGYSRARAAIPPPRVPGYEERVGPDRYRRSDNIESLRQPIMREERGYNDGRMPGVYMHRQAASNHYELSENVSGVERLHPVAPYARGHRQERAERGYQPTVPAYRAPLRAYEQRVLGRRFPDESDRPAAYPAARLPPADEDEVFDGYLDSRGRVLAGDSGDILERPHEQAQWSRQRHSALATDSRRARGHEDRIGIPRAAASRPRAGYAAEDRGFGDHAPLRQNHAPRRQDHAPRRQDHAPLPQDHAPLRQDHAPRRQDHAPRRQDHASLPQDHAPLPQDQARGAGDPVDAHHNRRRSSLGSLSAPDLHHGNGGLAQPHGQLSDALGEIDCNNSFDAHSLVIAEGASSPMLSQQALSLSSENVARSGRSGGAERNDLAGDDSK